MILVRSTKNCTNTPRILFALEELALPYRVERVPDGTFARRWGSPGPEITDGDVTTIEVGAILRHLARRANALLPATLAQHAESDRLFDFQARRISRAVEAKDHAEVERLMGFVEATLARTPFLLGDELSIVDVFYSHFAIPATRARMDYLARMPALSAYLDRVAARPAFVRALAANA
jgi:glutathione S-transferase